MDLLKVKTKDELIRIATINGHDKGAIDKLITKWEELQKPVRTVLKEDNIKTKDEY